MKHPRLLPQTFICEGCNEVITLRQDRPDWRRQYCSPKCKLRVWWRSHPRQVSLPRSAEYLLRQKQKREAVPFPICVCGVVCSQRQMKFCSAVCRRATRYRETCVEMQCRICGKDIPAREAGLGRRSTYCSRSCHVKSEAVRVAKRCAKARRKARERGSPSERVDPFVVFTRDGWRCQLCGCSTPKSLRGQMVDRAPELDHIVPLGGGYGGTHTYKNTQCLCRKCNGQKGATVLGQLRLALPTKDEHSAYPNEEPQVGRRRCRRCQRRLGSDQRCVYRSCLTTIHLPIRQIPVTIGVGGTCEVP